MSQHDYAIADQAGASFLADLNDAMEAVVTLNSGGTEPATTFAYQLWADTGTGKLRIRNAANNAWIEVGTLAAANLGLMPLSGGILTGYLTLSGAPTTGLHAATKAYVDSAGGAKLDKAGGTMTGALVLAGAPTENLHPVTKAYADSANASRVSKAGDTMMGALTLHGAPTTGLHAATKTYVDGTNSLGASGYTKLPSGVILQWGEVTVTNYTRQDPPVTAVTFPLAFTTVAHVVLTKNTTSSPSRLPTHVWAERGSSLTGFSVLIEPEDSGVVGLDTATLKAAWMAIGY